MIHLLKERNGPMVLTKCRPEPTDTRKTPVLTTGFQSAVTCPACLEKMRG